MVTARTASKAAVRLQFLHHLLSTVALTMSGKRI
jgi:hypothetical protein